MTSHRLLIHLGALSLIIGACAADNSSSSGTGGASGAHTGGASGTGGATTSSGGATGSGGETTATGGATSTGGDVGSGGQTETGGNSPGTAGAGSGGRTGGAGRDGTSTGGAGTVGTGGSTGAGGGGTAYPLKNPPVPSAGCGKPAGFTSSKYPEYRHIMSSGDQRDYVIDLPPTYDMNKPYRFIMGSHGIGGKGNDIQREKYYDLQAIAEAGSSTIFVSASGLGGSWGLKDIPLFDDILKFVSEGACVDTSRVFVLGFSFGGMYSYSLSMTRQKTIRAAIGMSAANFNIMIPPKNHAPIAWMQSTGMKDGMCPWVSNEAQMLGSKFIAIEHGTDNGCMVPNPIPTWTSGAMLCNDLPGCKAGYPTRICTFNGGHSLPFTSDHAATATWMWQFISQF